MLTSSVRFRCRSLSACCRCCSCFCCCGCRRRCRFVVVLAAAALLIHVGRQRSRNDSEAVLPCRGIQAMAGKASKQFRSPVCHDHWATTPHTPPPPPPPPPRLLLEIRQSRPRPPRPGSKKSTEQSGSPIEEIDRGSARRRPRLALLNAAIWLRATTRAPLRSPAPQAKPGPRSGAHISRRLFPLRVQFLLPPQSCPHPPRPRSPCSLRCPLQFRAMTMTATA